MALKKDDRMSVHCPNCGITLFKLNEGSAVIEIKCQSCKKIVNVVVLEDGTVATKLKTRTKKCE